MIYLRSIYLNTMAKPSPFPHMSNASCARAYRAAMKNAEQHADSSKRIARGKHYGHAVSHLVLSTEESVKALLYCGQSMGINIRQIKGIQMFFTDHIVRHQFATIFHAMSFIIEPMVSLFMKMRDELHEPEIKIPRNKVERAIESRDQNKLMVVFSDFPQMMDWWDDADRQKNRGNYVDYEGDVESPSDVTRAEYLMAKKITQKFRDDVNRLIASMEKASPADKKYISGPEIQQTVAELLQKLIDHRKDQRKSK